MRIVVIGAVAAGTSAAAKASRNNPLAEIVIYESDLDISYSGCGIPYYIGGEFDDVKKLAPRDVSFFKEKYNVDIFTGHKVLNINPEDKSVTVKNLKTGEEFIDKYDILVISTGAKPFVPNIKGVNSEHVFSVRNVQNARDIKQFINEKKPKSAVVAGTGFIGFEMLENLTHNNISVTIVEKQNKITQNLDEDMASFLEDILIKENIKVQKNANIVEIEKDKVILEDGTKIDSDIVIMATGVKPNVELAKNAGIEIGVTGAIKVNKKLQTSIKDIYACGDCIETYSSITGEPVYRPLGSTANKTGRIVGDVITGGSIEYKGNLSTSIFRIFNMTIANTGLSEKEALDLGYDIIVSHNSNKDKTSYFNGKNMRIKAIADKNTKKLLGVQIVGYDGVDKRIDVFVTLITYGAKIDELFHLDLAYAPPFSDSKDPVHYTGMVLEKYLDK